MERSSQVLTFGTPPDDFPLLERVVLRNSIAYLESQPGTSCLAHSDFLRRLPTINCWYGACDCPLFPFICVPSVPFTVIPTARKVLKELGASNFKSEHIASLDTT